MTSPSLDRPPQDLARGNPDAATPTDDARDWRTATALEMIAHLRSRHHVPLRRLLPELVRLAQRVETVHAARTDCPHGLAAHLQGMHKALESHLQKEERVLFPQLQVSPATQLATLIAQMRRDHAEQVQALQDLAALTQDLTMPAQACNSWQQLVLGLRQLRQDLMQCIDLENDVLFEGLNAPMSAGCSAGGGGCACAGSAG